MEHKSLADRFIEVMALIHSIDPSNDEPARHIMRRNRRMAEQLIDNALRQAFELAYQAQDMPAEVAKILAELRAAQQAPWSRVVESQTVTLNYSFAADVLSALFNSGGINPEAFERTRQAFAAIMRGEKVFRNDGRGPDWQAYAQAEAAAQPLQQEGRKDERAAFEEWHAERWGRPFRLGQTDQYKMDSSQGKWLAWKARAERGGCTCPSGDGSLRWPCPRHEQLPVAITDKAGPNGIKWYVSPDLPDGVNLYAEVK